MAKTASKTASISSLVRSAARNEELFQTIVQDLLEKESVGRLADFFDKMNIPRSTLAEGLLEPLPSVTVTSEKIGDFQEERAVSNGIQVYMERHARKIKWHSTHPSAEGSQNVLFVMRMTIMVTGHRLERLLMLLQSKDELTATEWAIAREIMNRTYLSFRNQLNLMSGPWMDAISKTVDEEELSQILGNFYEFIDTLLAQLEQMRESIEERRLELCVVPDGLDPVKPPNYFGGDLMGRGPWKQYWTNLNAKAHNFREATA